MNKITHLTDEQKVLLDQYYEECLAFGRSTEPANWGRAEEAITYMYQLLGHKRPEFVHVPSPQAALQYIKANLDGQESQENFKTYLWGQHEYYWIAFYRFGEMIGVQYSEEDSKLLAQWEALAQSCGWWWAFETVCVISDRPAELHLDEEGRLHNLTGAAMSFRDDYSLYSFWGRRVPEEWATKSADEMTTEEFASIRNVEQRSVYLRKMGIEKMESLGRKLDVDTSPNEYALIDLQEEIGADRAAPYLFMTNPSTGARHAEAVSHECQTVADAINWRAHQDRAKNWNPIILT